MKEKIFKIECDYDSEIVGMVAERFEDELFHIDLPTDSLEINLVCFYFGAVKSKRREIDEYIWAYSGGVYKQSKVKKHELMAIISDVSSKLNSANRVVNEFQSKEAIIKQYSENLNKQIRENSILTQNNESLRDAINAIKRLSDKS